MLISVFSFVNSNSDYISRSEHRTKSQYEDW